MRSNVRRNRRVLLRAARELFATSDDVAMSEVARRAGVGQATLYRHFPDRGALAAAVGHEVLDDLEQLTTSAVEPSEVFYVLLRGTMSSAAESAGLVRLLREGSNVDSRQALQERLITLFARPLRDAKAAGSVRRDLKATDVLLLIQMLQGVIDSAGSEPKPRVDKSERALKFLMDGIRPLTGDQDDRSPGSRLRPALAHHSKS